MSYARAKRLLRLRRATAERIDAILTIGSQRLKLCGNGKRHNWSVLVSDVFFVNCACCLFWRGCAAGAAAGATVTALAATVIAWAT
jgi:hypothetical protein